MLGSVGHECVRDPAYNWHGLKRGRAEFALFQYTLAGTGRLRTGAREQLVRPGTAMLLHFPDDNQYWLPADSADWEFIYVCLHGREVARLWRSIETRLGALTAFANDSASVACARRIVAEALSDNITHAFAASAFAYELIMHLAAAARTAPAGAHTAALQRACDHAEQNLHLPLTVETMARQAGFSRYHFTRLFTAHTGLSPAAWLVEQRVRETARLLRGTSLPLKEIAVRCGFPDANYLSRVFRRHSGMPPGAYRRSGA